ncbi:MAG: bifunctional 5,10-methylenetetrahydrofolate dehydrogenase/5,10-methenyltetrahydrofolate cyclohydrolase [Candidatus Cloacimonetes bacterium]|nr:bifunctional 5,10-methylenetetrahydrofolate dehydrogenase/5,10-methenyltetrahydrofolate cyclohydrolase [Candidatus Cloacimonadota bacterium]
MDKILTGKPVATLIRQETSDLILKHKLRPKLLLIQIGEDPASEYYVQNIVRSAQKIGCEVDFCPLDVSLSQDALLGKLHQANTDDSIHGIMLQKPLPKGFDENLINQNINPDKDVDGIHPLNLGKLWLEMEAFVPCTAQAVIETLKHYEIKPEGKKVVILGRSAVVGKPLAALLLSKTSWGNASLSVCHSRSVDLVNETTKADIVIAAIGKSEFVKAGMIKKDSILIDVGINETILADGTSTYCGDIDYNSCFDKCLAITPVPGGIGSITTSLLIKNLALACLRAQGHTKNY